MARLATFAALALTLDATYGMAEELSGKSWNKKVGGKKAAFVKFLAPW